MLSRRLLPQFFVLLFLALLVHGAAQAQGRGIGIGIGIGNRPGPVAPVDPYRPYPPSYERDVVVLRENVFQNYNNQSSIDLKRLFRLNAQHRGMELEQIVVRASSAAGRGQMALEINNILDGQRQTVGQYSSDLFFFADPYAGTLGQDIRAAELIMRGNIYVETIEIKLRTQSRSREEVLQTALWDYINYNKTYPVRNALNMGAQYNGKALSWVEIKGTSPRANATARLMINGRQTGMVQTFNSFDTTLRFLLPRGGNVLGRDIQNVQIEVNGTVHVMELKAGLQGANTPPNRRPPAFVEELTNLHLTSFQNISLESVITDSRRQDLSRFAVASVEITARARFHGAIVRLCENNGGWNSGTCQQPQSVGTMVTNTVHFANGIPFGEIEIQNSGEMVIQKVVVRFQR